MAKFYGMKRRKKLTDMYLDDKISETAYSEKCEEIEKKLDAAEKQKSWIILIG